MVTLVVFHSILFASRIAREVPVFKKEAAACCGILGVGFCPAASVFSRDGSAMVSSAGVDLSACRAGLRLPMHEVNHMDTPVFRFSAHVPSAGIRCCATSVVARCSTTLREESIYINYLNVGNRILALHASLCPIASSASASVRDGVTICLPLHALESLCGLAVDPFWTDRMMCKDEHAYV